MSALPSNLTLAILRPGNEMALMAVEDGRAVLFNTGQSDSALVTDWATRLGVRQVTALVVTNPNAPFSGGCARLASAVPITFMIAPSDTPCGGAPSPRSLESLRPGQVLQIGHISLGILSVEPLVATLDYGAVRIVVAPEPACPTLTRLAAEGLAPPDLVQLAQTSPCQPWGKADPRAVAFTPSAEGNPGDAHGDHLGPGGAIAFTSDGTALVRHT